MIKLIVTDLDGTLLKRGTQALSPSTLALIAKVKEQGILFAAASGRQYPNMRRLFDYVGEDMYYVCENGSLIIHKEKEYFKKSMEKELSIELIEDIYTVEENFVKVSMYMAGYERVPEEINSRFREKYSKQLLVTDSGNGWLDFVPQGSSKGTAIEYLMEHLQITPEEIMVFGDHENDISMLKLTDNSYIMAHSSDYMKQYAKQECETVDEILVGVTN